MQNEVRRRDIKALRHSLWIRWFSTKDSIGFYEDIHTKQRRADINQGN